VTAEFAWQKPSPLAARRFVLPFASVANAKPPAELSDSKFVQAIIKILLLADVGVIVAETPESTKLVLVVDPALVDVDITVWMTFPRIDEVVSVPTVKFVIVADETAVIVETFKPELKILFAVKLLIETNPVIVKLLEVIAAPSMPVSAWTAEKLAKAESMYIPSATLNVFISVQALMF